MENILVLDWLLMHKKVTKQPVALALRRLQSWQGLSAYSFDVA